MQGPHFWACTEDSLGPEGAGPDSEGKDVCLLCSRLQSSHLEPQQGTQYLCDGWVRR